MNARWWKTLPVVAVLCAGPMGVFGGTVTLDFESLADSTFVTTQFAGTTFSSAIVLTSGISLNELDFPPHSGMNVISDSNGAISIIFSTPVLSFAGYFTYVVPVTASGFDGSNALLTSAVSQFSNNTVSAGDPGSNANELVQISSVTGFSKVILTGDPAGSSFTLDDITYTTALGDTVPEPSSILLVGLGSLLLIARSYRRKR